MIDNVIVMAYHIISRNNIKAFMPMLAATLTSIGALSIIFFLDYDLKLTFVDFSMAIIINLVSSLFTATFFVPALMEKMGVQKKNIMYSRRLNGPYPYVSGASDAEKYNRSLSEISAEVDANNMDMFINGGKALVMISAILV